MSIDPIDRLAAAGLRLHLPEPEKFRATMKQYGQNGEPAEIAYCIIEPPSLEALGLPATETKQAFSYLPRAFVYWFMQVNSWALIVSEGFGGFAESDFVCLFSDFDALATASIEFYLGSPTTIKGWVIPLHRHPEIGIEDVTLALETSTLITPAIFRQIKSDISSHARMKRSSGYYKTWEEAKRSTFIKFRSEDSSRMFVVRRDFQQSFIIDLPSTETLT